MNGKRNRTKGHDFERIMRVRFLKWFPDCLTSRYASRKRDDEKVDLVGCDPFNVQTKAVEKIASLHRILRNMPEDSNINLVIHKRNRQGITVTMTWEDFEELLDMLKGAGAI